MPLQDSQIEKNEIDKNHQLVLASISAFNKPKNLQVSPKSKSEVMNLVKKTEITAIAVGISFRPQDCDLKEGDPALSLGLPYILSDGRVIPHDLCVSATFSAIARQKQIRKIIVLLGATLGVDELMLSRGIKNPEDVKHEAEREQAYKDLFNLGEQWIEKFDSKIRTILPELEIIYKHCGEIIQERDYINQKEIFKNTLSEDQKAQRLYEMHIQSVYERKVKAFKEVTQDSIRKYVNAEIPIFQVLASDFYQVDGILYMGGCKIAAYLCNWIEVHISITAVEVLYNKWKKKKTSKKDFFVGDQDLVEAESEKLNEYVQDILSSGQGIAELTFEELTDYAKNRFATEQAAQRERDEKIEQEKLRLEQEKMEFEQKKARLVQESMENIKILLTLQSQLIGGINQLFSHLLEVAVNSSRELEPVDDPRKEIAPILNAINLVSKKSFLNKNTGSDFARQLAKKISSSGDYHPVIFAGLLSSKGADYNEFNSDSLNVNHL